MVLEGVRKSHKGWTVLECLNTPENYNWRFPLPVDQIANLIEGLKTDPYGRRHVVMAWNPSTVWDNLGCLPPCHLGFQCYVTNDGYLNLKWWQR